MLEWSMNGIWMAYGIWRWSEYSGNRTGRFHLNIHGRWMECGRHFRGILVEDYWNMNGIWNLNGPICRIWIEYEWHSGGLSTCRVQPTGVCLHKWPILMGKWWYTNINHWILCPIFRWTQECCFEWLQMLDLQKWLVHIYFFLKMENGMPLQWYFEWGVKTKNHDILGSHPEHGC